MGATDKRADPPPATSPRTSNRPFSAKTITARDELRYPTDRKRASENARDRDAAFRVLARAFDFIHGDLEREKAVVDAIVVLFVAGALWGDKPLLRRLVAYLLSPRFERSLEVAEAVRRRSTPPPL